MGLISWLIFGLIAGAIAKLIMPGKDPGGFVVTVLIGIAGALIGGFVGRAFGVLEDTTRFWSPMDWLFSVLGGLIVLFIWKKIAATKSAK